MILGGTNDLAADAFPFGLIQQMVCQMKSVLKMFTSAIENNNGKSLYQNACQNCHKADGAGMAGMFPPLIRICNRRSQNPCILY